MDLIWTFPAATPSSPVEEWRIPNTKWPALLLWQATTTSSSQSQKISWAYSPGYLSTINLIITLALLLHTTRMLTNSFPTAYSSTKTLHIPAWSMTLLLMPVRNANQITPCRMGAATWVRTVDLITTSTTEAVSLPLPIAWTSSWLEGSALNAPSGMSLWVRCKGKSATRLYLRHQPKQPKRILILLIPKAINQRQVQVQHKRATQHKQLNLIQTTEIIWFPHEKQVQASHVILEVTYLKVYASFILQIA